MSPAQLQSFLPGAKGNYLEVTVFVQNRTSGKKATPMVVIGNAMTAVTTAKGTKVLLDSKIPSQTYSTLFVPFFFFFFLSVADAVCFKWPGRHLFESSTFKSDSYQRKRG